MIRDLELRVAPEQLGDSDALVGAAARSLGIGAARITRATLLRRSIDARHRPAVYSLRVRVWVDEAARAEPAFELQLADVGNARPIVIVGSGPAGLFAALKLIEGGLRPIVVERGKDVRSRRLDVARLNRDGVVDGESNYCYGEGGAGTFSDGKLYTRATKRGDVERILNILVEHGADRDILIDAHPHIGTNRLPGVVQRLRETIVEHGGVVRFGTRVSGLLRRDGSVVGVTTIQGDRIEGAAVLLATGHSARDVYAMLHREGVALEAKPFALGVRVEHPQALIDSIQYHCPTRPAGLPPAAYSLLHRIDGRGVYSFCMCPGGVICPTATAQDEVVVNGWSPSRRDSRWANSGIVVETGPQDLKAFAERSAEAFSGAAFQSSIEPGAEALAGVAFQSSIERAAAQAGGGLAVAPAQRLVDFIEGRASADLPDCSYLPGLRATDVAAVLPAQIATALRAGLRAFGGKMPGYLTNEAVVVGVETRTSAPVRIPRDRELCTHPAVPGLYPCGEGAGAAGGIVSAAMDGERCAAAILRAVRGA